MMENHAGHHLLTDEDKNPTKDATNNKSGRGKRKRSVSDISIEPRRGQREKRNVERLSFPPLVKKKKKLGVSFEKGEGASLGSLEVFTDALNQIKSKEDLCRKLSIFLFKVPGQWSTRKRDIKLWSGVPEANQGEEKKKNGCNIGTKVDYPRSN